MYYTTKIVPERYLLDNELISNFRGCKKVCDSAHFLCDFAQSTQRIWLKYVFCKNVYLEISL